MFRVLHKLNTDLLLYSIPSRDTCTSDVIAPPCKSHDTCTSDVTAPPCRSHDTCTSGMTASPCRSLMCLSSLAVVEEMAELFRNNLLPSADEVAALSLQFAQPPMLDSADLSECKSK